MQSQRPPWGGQYLATSHSPGSSSGLAGSRTNPGRRWILGRGMTHPGKPDEVPLNAVFIKMTWGKQQVLVCVWRGAEDSWVPSSVGCTNGQRALGFPEGAVHRALRLEEGRGSYVSVLVQGHLGPVLTWRPHIEPCVPHPATCCRPSGGHERARVLLGSYFAFHLHLSFPS